MQGDQPSQLFGFHPNADIIKDINSTDDFLKSTLIVSAGQIGNKVSDENQTQVVDSNK
jgi:hypothetical protein